MALRQFQENRTKIHTRTDQLVDVAHDIATKQLIPQIAKMSRNAVTVDRTEFFFYRRKRTGRRCSCFNVEATPDGGCQVCFQTGIVAAYDKYGCYDEILDVTRPGIRLVNIRPAYELMRRPVLFALDDGAKTGMIEFDISVRPNVHLTDLIQLNCSVQNPAQSKVAAFLRTSPSQDYIPLSDASLNAALYSQTISVQIRVSREKVSVASPLVRNLWLRYKVMENTRIVADVPVRQESIVLVDSGMYQTEQQLTMFLPDNPRKVGNEDFFIMVEEGTRWRVVETAPNRPSTQLTSSFLTCQNVSVTHPIYDFPV